MARHSLVYGFDNYTQTGIFTTTKLNDQWTMQLGLSNGTDVALWQKDPGNQPTGTVMLQWISPNQKRFHLRRATMRSTTADFGYNNLQQIVGTWTHKFNDKLYTATEALYMYMRRCEDAPDAAVPFQSGSFPVKRGYASEWGIVNYTMLRHGAGGFLHRPQRILQ